MEAANIDSIDGLLAILHKNAPLFPYPVESIVAKKNFRGGIFDGTLDNIAQ